MFFDGFSVEAEEHAPQQRYRNTWIPDTHYISADFLRDALVNRLGSSASSNFSASLSFLSIPRKVSSLQNSSQTTEQVDLLASERRQQKTHFSIRIAYGPLYPQDVTTLLRVLAPRWTLRAQPDMMRTQFSLSWSFSF